MATRRMFSRDVCTSDAFLDMPSTSKLLYFYLGLYADDEGFLNNPKLILRAIGATTDDLNVLILKNFVIPFNSGVIVITHWRVNNYLQNDRVKPTTCVQEKAALRINSAREYEQIQGKNGLYTSCIQPGYNAYTQYSIEEYRVGVVEERAGARESVPASAPADPPAGMLSFDEIASRRADIERAEGLIRRYRLPDGDPTMDALLEDAERYGWERLEAALQTASLSNSRKGLSVNFYRSVIAGHGRSEPQNGRDPYAGYTSI